MNGYDVNEHSWNESLTGAMCFQCDFMAKGCVGPFPGTRFLLHDTGMLMYDIVAPFLGSFLHMVNSFSRPVSGQFTEGTEALLHGDFSWTYSSTVAAAAVAETPNRNSVVGSGCIFLWFHVKHGRSHGQLTKHLFQGIRSCYAFWFICLRFNNFKIHYFLDFFQTFVKLHFTAAFSRLLWTPNPFAGTWNAVMLDSLWSVWGWAPPHIMSTIQLKQVLKSLAGCQRLSFEVVKLQMWDLHQDPWGPSHRPHTECILRV